MSRRLESLQLGSIELFCKAAELGGFTAAAESLGVTPAAVSRSVGRLETRLGVRLFARTTRQIRLTEEGRDYFDQCRQALARIAEAERVLAGQQAVPTGLLRLSVPTTYGHYRLLPLLPGFLARYPQVRVDLQIVNRNVDLIEEDYDLAIRRGPPQDSRLVARKLEDASLGLFAAPAYLRQRGWPRDLTDLPHHDCIQFVLPSTGRPAPWLVRDQGVAVDLLVEGRVRCYEDVLGCMSYAQAGGGICQIYHFIAQAAVVRGELVEVLQSFGGRSQPFSLLYPRNQHPSAKVRALVDFLIEAVRPGAVTLIDPAGSAGSASRSRDRPARDVWDSGPSSPS